MGQCFFPTRMIASLFLMLLCLSSVNAQDDWIEKAVQQNPQLQEVQKKAYEEAYKKTIPLLQEMHAGVEKLAGGLEDPITAASLNNVAEYCLINRDYIEAERLFLRVLAIREKVLGSDHLETAVSLNNLAALYYATGAYAKAKPFLLRALAISGKPPVTKTPLTGDDAGFELRAVEIYEKVLGPDHPATALSLSNLAEFYGVAGAHAKAEPLYQRALEIREKALGPDHLDVALSLSNLAEFYRITNRYAKAEPLLLSALEIREKALGRDHLDVALSLSNLAEFYYTSAAYTKAEPLYQRALEIREKALGSNHLDTLASLNNLALLYYATNAYAQALPLMERAQSIEENNTTEFLLSNQKEMDRLAHMQLRRGNVDINVSFSLATAHPRAKALGLTGVLQYKGRALGMTSAGIGVMQRSGQLEDRVLLNQRTEVAKQLSYLTVQRPLNLSDDAYSQELKRLLQLQETLEEEVSRRSAGRFASTINLGDVRKAMPSDGVLVEWFRYQPFDPKMKEGVARSATRYVAYVLRPMGDVIAIDLGTAQPIDALATEFRNALSSKHTYVNEVARELSEKLMKPLRSHLAQSERLLMSPDGVLSLVPFAALVDENGEYLAQHYEITYLTGGGDLLRMYNSTIVRENEVVVANPDYGRVSNKIVRVGSAPQTLRSPDLDRSGLVFQPLIGTKAEAKALQSLLRLDDESILTGPKATKTRLMKLHGPKMLHVATHGFFLDDQKILGENPLRRSGLALAGANARRSGDNDDGILTAAEVATLDLYGTQLVVLSACDTAVGQVQNGEGVYGLRRALVLAGAHSQLISLWKVKDAITQTLMKYYYQHLLNGEGRSGALRSVQKAMILEHRHPYYWAPFILSGNWSPLPR